MIICICKKVSDKQICNAIEHGCCSVEELQLELGVCIQCKKCKPYILEQLETQKNRSDNMTQ